MVKDMTMVEVETCRNNNEGQTEIGDMENTSNRKWWRFQWRRRGFI